MESVGTVIYGKHGGIIIRQKTESGVELGDLLVVEQNKDNFSILQVFDLQYGSQIAEKDLELYSGMALEGIKADLGFMEPFMRNYVLAMVKSVINVKVGEDKKKKPFVPKKLPQFMSNVRLVTAEDLGFLESPKNPVYLGKVRSGSKVLDVNVNLDGIDVFTHHILIPATTGRGKSNLLKTMLWSVVKENYCGLLVLDPHDEYYGRHGRGLKDHPDAKDKIVYYSINEEIGCPKLVLNLKTIKPWHFKGIIEFTDPQNDAMILAFSQFPDNWLCKIMEGTPIEDVKKETVKVLRRKISTALGISIDEENEQKKIVCRNKVFSESSGENTVKEIIGHLESGKKVIIDTSKFSDKVELLIGSIILNDVFDTYKRYKLEGTSDDKPVISVVVEEAPRVLGKDVLENGDNIFSTIAKEGRKFKVGLTAITQLTSIIPQVILANMNTKIILGNELAAERSAIIGSASQDLSTDDQNIASLDVGEAIVSSNFTKFAIPISIPKFEDFVKEYLRANNGAKKVSMGVIM
jgi:hypothetical protein